MAKSIKEIFGETPVFIMESEATAWAETHPEYHVFVKVYYNDKSFAGYLAYKEGPKQK